MRNMRARTMTVQYRHRTRSDQHAHQAQISAKRVIRRAPANRPSVIARSPADAYLALVLLRLRGTSSHAIGLPNVKNPTPIEQDQGVQLQKASANPGQQALICALAVIASPALACLQVSTMAYTG